MTMSVPDSKLLQFQNKELKDIGKNLIMTHEDKLLNIKKAKKENTFRVFGFLKPQKRGSVTSLTPLDEIVDGIGKELKSIRTKDKKDEYFLANFLIEKLSEHFINGKKIQLVEIIFHILKKNQKNENEINILKLYFLKMEKLISLLIPLKINIFDMLVKLVCQIKCEKKSKNMILFKAGDIGEKLYILLKGNVGILITKEKTLECTPLEFIKYLILLHLYQEENLFNEAISKNKGTLNIDEKAFLCLLHVFKFYNFLKENNRLHKYYQSIYDFIQGEHKINAYIHKKFNYSPLMSLDNLNYERTTIDQLYLFYARKIKEIKKNLRFGLTGSALIATFIKRQIKPSINTKPQTQEELLNFLKPYDEGRKKFKSEEEYFQKISSINEISLNKILTTSEEKYIERLDSDTLYESIKEDTNNYIEDFDLIAEQNEKFKVFIYYEINQLFAGSIFGELALSDPNSKRTATIVTKEDCYFGTIIKQVYDLSLRAAQEKSRLRNVLFFTRGPIFNGISNNIFLNKFFYTFKKCTYKKGDILFRKGEPRKSIIFVIKGELELSRYMTLYDITKLINLLGGVLDDKYLTFLCNTYYQINQYYYNYKQNIKCCVLKDKEIIGLDDLTLDDTNIFTCKCVSTEKTELYEIDYNTFKEAKKYSKIRDNIMDFVNSKRSLFIKILLKQRNALISNELNKIKKAQLLQQNTMNVHSSSKKSSRNIFLPITKNEKFSEKKIIFSYSQKTKRGDGFIILRNKNSKNLQKLEKSKIFNTFSMREVDYEKNILNRMNIKNFTLSVKDNNTNNNSKLLSSIRSYKTKENSFKIKNRNHMNLQIKKTVFNRNTTLSGNENQSNNSTQVTPSNNFISFNKTTRPFISKIYHSRTRKKLIPFFSYSNSKKIKGEITPLIFKEYQKKFPELRNNIYVNNFYIENQKIFDSLLSNDNKYNLNCVSKTDRNKSKNEKETTVENKLINSYNSKDNEKNNSNDNGINKGNQTENHFFKRKKQVIYKPAGIIDFLCLDNWEEKEHFQKNFLSQC